MCLRNTDNGIGVTVCLPQWERDTAHCFVKSEEFPKIVCNVQMYFQNIFNKRYYLEVFGYLLKNHGDNWVMLVTIVSCSVKERIHHLIMSQLYCLWETVFYQKTRGVKIHLTWSVAGRAPWPVLFHVKAVFCHKGSISYLSWRKQQHAEMEEGKQAFSSQILGCLMNIASRLRKAILPPCLVLVRSHTKCCVHFWAVQFKRDVVQQEGVQWRAQKVWWLGWVGPEALLVSKEEEQHPSLDGIAG